MKKLNFFQEEELNWENFGKNKWLWLLDQDENISEIMVNKYFVSVLLPNYLIKYEILLNSITKDDYTGINYLSFETRIIR